MLISMDIVLNNVSIKLLATYIYIFHKTCKD